MLRSVAVLLLCSGLAICSETVGGEDFQPLFLTLDILEDIEYSFDGSMLSIQ